MGVTWLVNSIKPQRYGLMHQIYLDGFVGLERHGWTILLGEHIGIPSAIRARYPWISTELEVVLGELKEAVSPDEQTWLLSTLDYSGQTDAAFSWDEWEKQSIEAAEKDEEWIQTISTFWNSHFPICLSVSEGYSYYALTADGSVVHGREPEFEECTIVARSYAEFLAQVAGEPT